MRRISRAEFSSLQQLRRPRERRDQGRFIVPGRKCIEELLNSGRRPELALLVQDRAEEAAGCFGEDLLHELEAGDALLTLREHEAARLAEQPHPEGLLAVASLAGFQELGAFEELCGTAAAQEPPTLLLDGISDPGNMGGILRCALWFGMDRVLLHGETVDPWSPRLIRASMGALFHLTTLVEVEGPQVEALRASGHRLLALEAAGGETLADFEFLPGDVLVLGSESHGIRLPAEFVDRRIHVPGAGRAESLNVGHAFAACAWEIFRRGWWTVIH